MSTHYRKIAAAVYFLMVIPQKTLYLSQGMLNIAMRRTNLSDKAWQALPDPVLFF